MNQCKLDRAVSAAAVAAWMAVIFLFSAQTGNQSGDTSGRILRWLVRLLYQGFESLPQWQQLAILDGWHLVIRKGAHFTEYAVLGMLICNAVRTYPLKSRYRWTLPIAGGAVYAVMDEIHQYFVPERACRFVDMCIDTAGTAFGTAVFLLGAYLIRKRKQREKTPHEK